VRDQDEISDATCFYCRQREAQQMFEFLLHAAERL